MLTGSSRKVSLEHWNWRLYKVRTLFLGPFTLKQDKLLTPGSNQESFMAKPMLFAPFGYTHPPSSVPPFLLMWNLSPKDIARYDIMKLKVSRCIYMPLVGKGPRYVHPLTSHIPFTLGFVCCGECQDETWTE